jgi:hypothetical protein
MRAANSRFPFRNPLTIDPDQGIIDSMNDTYDSDYDDTFITDADADWRWEDGEYIEESYEDDREVFYDDDAFASAGWGTDEAYGYIEDNDPAHGDFF